MLERYSTEKIGSAQRIRRWCEFGSDSHAELSVRPRSPGQFQARMLRAVIGGLGVTQTRTTPAVAEGQGGKVGHWASAERDAVLLTLQKSGHCRLSQAGRESTLNPGDVVIRDLRRKWEIDACEETTLISIKCPVSAIAPCVGGLDGVVAVPLRAGDVRADLLAGIIDHLGRIVFETKHPPEQVAVRQLILGSLRVAFAGQCNDEEYSVYSDRQRVLQHVENRIRDSSLTVAGLAKGLGISVRSLQRTFFVCGSTPRAHILTRRLELAAEMLRSPLEDRALRVTSIAYDCGFNDASYFGRAFHSKYGVSPREFARRVRPAD